MWLWYFPLSFGNNQPHEASLRSYENLGNGQIPSFDVRQKILSKRERRADTRTHSFSLQTSIIAFFLFLFFSFLLSVFLCPMQWSVHCVFSFLSSLLFCHTLCGERTMQKPHALEDSTTRWNGGALDWPLKGFPKWMDIAITKLSNELALVLFEHARQAWSLVKK